MDILKILKENSDNVIKEDLEFFEIELATGEYDKEYIAKCLELIKEIRQFRNIKVQKIEKVNIDNLFLKLNLLLKNQLLILIM